MFVPVRNGLRVCPQAVRRADAWVLARGKNLTVCGRRIEIVIDASDNVRTRRGRDAQRSSVKINTGRVIGRQWDRPRPVNAGQS